MKELNRNKKLNRNRLVTINGAAARTQGNYSDRNKERYYYIYPNPERLPMIKSN
ncbi:MAG: hypothetical protein WCP96_09335 [Methylococcaceae bacterium]